MLGQSLPPASYKMLGPSAAPHPALGFWEEQVLPSYGHITMASQRWKWSMVNEPGNWHLQQPQYSIRINRTIRYKRLNNHPSWPSENFLGFGLCQAQKSSGTVTAIEIKAGGSMLCSADISGYVLLLLLAFLSLL